MIRLGLEYALIYLLVWVAERREPAFVRSTIALAVSTFPRILSFLVAAALAAVSPPHSRVWIAFGLLFAIPVALLRIYLSYAWGRCAFYGALGVGVAVLSDVATTALTGVFVG